LLAMRVIGFRLVVSVALFAMSLVALSQVIGFSQTDAGGSTSIQPLAVAATTSTTADSQTRTSKSLVKTSSRSSLPSTTVAPPAPGSTTTGPPPTAEPTTDEPAPGTTTLGDHEQRGEAALAIITYPWRSKLPGWTIEFKETRSGVLGYTFTNDKRIEVYVRDSMSPDLLAHVIAHEIGHAVDVTLNSGDERRTWLNARGIPESDWWPGEGGVSDFRSGAGDFAEGFAAWQVGTGSYRSKMGSAPNSDQLELLATLATN
jgi:hypothetical protein